MSKELLIYCLINSIFITVTFAKFLLFLQLPYLSLTCIYLNFSTVSGSSRKAGEQQLTVKNVEVEGSTVCLFSS